MLNINPNIQYYLLLRKYFTWANILVAIPNPILNIKIELPPLLINGNGTPVIGIEAVTPPMLTTPWTTSKLANPKEYIAENVFLDFVPEKITFPININSKLTTNTTPKNPNSSAIIARMKSVWASGKYPNFWIEFPKPLPNKPPLPKATYELMTWSAAAAKSSENGFKNTFKRFVL